MNHVNRQLVTDQEPSSLLPLPLVKVLDRLKQTEPLKLIWWCLALSILSGTLLRYSSLSSGFMYGFLVVAGSGGCAWFWLLSRTLFRDSNALHSKAALLVPVIILIESIETLLPEASSQGASSEFYRVFTNIASFTCIAAIAYVWNEALNGFNQIRAQKERRFRLLFLSFFSIPVAIAILWVMGAETGTLAAEWQNTLLTFCALIGLVVSRVSVEYRLKTISSHAPHSERASLDLSQDQETENLADKLLQAINTDDLLTKPNLKVSDLADHLNEHEYKVTRCITHRLKYRNFNHMLNQHRIDRAIKTFKDSSSNHLKVATIAFDCGYNSLGPFNRAFKQHTGMTPREFRQRLTTD